MGSSQADQNVKVELTSEQLKRLHDMLEDRIQMLYDDPSDEPEEIREYHQEFVGIALALGFDFIGCVERVATPYEKSRMAKILAGDSNTEA